jgi:putative flippase GtrA
MLKPYWSHQFLGFTLSGALSTLLMFGIYVVLNKFINYQLSYLISYVIAVIALYFMNAIVFKSSISMQTFLAFPLIYLLQYLIGAALLEIIVHLGFSVTFAPILAVVLLLPLTFFLNKKLFSKD